LIDDIVFLCFFVGNDFLPHLPSLDIRVGALDYLFNVYKRILPSLGDYITNHGGQVNLSRVDVILAEVGSIEDYVFTMKHENEVREKERREQFKARKKHANGNSLDDPRNAVFQKKPRVMGRAARILEKEQAERSLKKEVRGKINSSHMKSRDNLQAAVALKESLNDSRDRKKEEDQDAAAKNQEESSLNESRDNKKEEEDQDAAAKNDAGMDLDEKDEDTTTSAATKIESKKRKVDEVGGDSGTEKETNKTGIGEVGNMEDEFDDDEEDEDENSSAVVSAFKERVKDQQKKKLDEYARTVEDKVRLHEKGWKDRYYSDKCKADDVANHGGREHLFRSYVTGLCWVMKYYYEGCPSWKWYYPFHYAPFASDLRNIERFQKDVKSFELSTPFSPVEQLMAVLPSDSSHAIPNAGRWLMSDLESPIIDFYPSEVPVDPNGKAMPWLWVVLLPFIDEDRLLAAMSPTMAKWTKQELLCNARGLDEGYVYLHSSHPLAPKLKHVLQDGKTAKSPKQRLTDAASYGCPGFSGSFRPPLGNEIIAESEVIPAPDLSAKAIMTSEDNLFTEAISKNYSICVAFTEPPKLSHKSIMLPGTILPHPVLMDEDKRIIKPRLNRGGQSIAFMGGSDNRQSHQVGRGSMNISSYERDLAQRNGRGHEMNKAGTRQWGSFQPTPKRQFNAPNPFRGNTNGGPPPPPPPPPPPQRPPWQQHQDPRNGYRQQHNNQQRQQYNQQQQQQQQQQHTRHPNYSNTFRPNQQNRTQGYQQHQHYTMSHNNMVRGPQMPPRGNRVDGTRGQSYNQRQHQPHGSNQNHSRGHYQQSQQGFNFRSHNQTSGPSSGARQSSGAVTNNVMNSLKAQLKSTLKQNRRGNDRR